MAILLAVAMIRIGAKAPVETKPVERITWTCTSCQHPSNWAHYRYCAECGSWRPPPAPPKQSPLKGGFGKPKDNDPKDGEIDDMSGYIE